MYRIKRTGPSIDPCGMPYLKRALLKVKSPADRICSSVLSKAE